MVKGKQDAAVEWMEGGDELEQKGPRPSFATARQVNGGNIETSNAYV